MLLFILHWVSADAFEHDAQAAHGPDLCDVYDFSFVPAVPPIATSCGASRKLKGVVVFHIFKLLVLCDQKSKTRRYSFMRLVKRALSNVKSYIVSPTCRRPAKSLIKPHVLKNNELTERKLHTNTHTTDTKSCAVLCLTDKMEITARRLYLEFLSIETTACKFNL